MHEIDAHIGVDPEDWDDVLRKVESSYAIHFGNGDLSHVRTLGDLIDVIVAKVAGVEADDCTTQQAFYRIRQALAVRLNVHPSSIAPDTVLEELVPRRRRRAVFNDLEKGLGLRLRVFRLKSWIQGGMAFLFIASLVAFFWSGQVALFGLGGLAGLLQVALSTTKEFNISTVGGLADRMSQHAYKLMRRDYGTVNRKEIRTKLHSFFRSELGLEAHQLREDVLIVP